jgi:asparagine N-glycosylation enzyme membrane subunit Stt3
MQDLFGFVDGNVAVIRASVGDPVFLLLLVLTLFSGLWFGWVSGFASVVILALVRVAFVDWQEFVPDAPPSPILPYIFTATVCMALIVLALAKGFQAWRRNMDVIQH